MAQQRSDELAMQEAAADNRRMGHCATPLLQYVATGKILPAIGSTVRLSGLLQDENDFDGMLATVLPHSDLSLNSNCYRVRLHCLHRGRSLLITRASNTMPVLDDYNRPHLGIYK